MKPTEDENMNATTISPIMELNEDSAKHFSSADSTFNIHRSYSLSLLKDHKLGEERDKNELAIF